jgi:hypothetical protein
VFSFFNLIGLGRGYSLATVINSNPMFFFFYWILNWMMNCVATVRAGGNASNVEAKKTKRFLCGLQDPCKCLFATWWPWKCMGNNRRGWKSNNTVHLSQAQDDPSSGKAHESIIINEFSSNTLRGLWKQAFVMNLWRWRYSGGCQRDQAW